MLKVQNQDHPSFSYMGFNESGPSYHTFDRGPMEQHSRKPEDDTSTEEPTIINDKGDERAPIASLAEDSSISRTTNTVLITTSWLLFGAGGYFIYWSFSNWHGNSVAKEATLALTTFLGILCFPIGIFVRRWAYHGFSKALGNTLTPGSPW